MFSMNPSKGLISKNDSFIGFLENKLSKLNDQSGGSFSSKTGHMRK